MKKHFFFSFLFLLLPPPIFSIGDLKSPEIDDLFQEAFSEENLSDLKERKIGDFTALHWLAEGYFPTQQALTPFNESNIGKKLLSILFNKKYSCFLGVFKLCVKRDPIGLARYIKENFSKDVFNKKYSRYWDDVDAQWSNIARCYDEDKYYGSWIRFFLEMGHPVERNHFTDYLERTLQNTKINDTKFLVKVFETLDKILAQKNFNIVFREEDINSLIKCEISPEIYARIIEFFNSRKLIKHDRMMRLEKKILSLSRIRFKGSIISPAIFDAERDLKRTYQILSLDAKRCKIFIEKGNVIVIIVNDNNYNNYNWCVSDFIEQKIESNEPIRNLSGYILSYILNPKDNQKAIDYLNKKHKEYLATLAFEIYKGLLDQLSNEEGEIFFDIPFSSFEEYCKVCKMLLNRIIDKKAHRLFNSLPEERKEVFPEEIIRAFMCEILKKTYYSKMIMLHHVKGINIIYNQEFHLLRYVIEKDIFKTAEEVRDFLQTYKNSTIQIDEAIEQRWLLNELEYYGQESSNNFKFDVIRKLESMKNLHDRQVKQKYRNTIKFNFAQENRKLSDLRLPDMTKEQSLIQLYAPNPSGFIVTKKL